MALRERLLPWDSQPQEAVRADPAHPLARTLDNLWLPDAIEPVDVISGLRITGAPAGSALGIGVGGRAIVGTTGGSAAALPSAVSAYPAVLVAYGTFTANNGWTLLSFTGSGASLSLGVSSTGNAQLIVRRNFGTARTMAGAATYPVGTPVCAIVQIFSDTDYRLYANGEQTNGTLSFGTGGTWLTSQLPLAAQHPGSLFLAGQGFGRGSISDADALAISANPALLWQIFEPRRVLVPVIAAAGTSVLVPLATAAATAFAPTVSTPNAVAVPAASVVSAAFAPAVSTPYAIAIPAASLALSTPTPTVTIGAGKFIAVPAAAITASVLAPAVTAGGGVAVAVPAATIGAFAYAPSVLAGSGASISVPLGAVSLTARAPSVQTKAPDPLRFDIATGRLVKVLSAAVAISF